MLIITHVLCPVDLSAASADALRYATELSSVLRAELSVLLVSAAASGGVENPDAPGLAAFIATTVSPGTELQHIHRYGEPTDEILGTSHSIGSDLLIMGSHGRTGLKRLLLGSVSEAVVRRSATPVLVVPRTRSGLPKPANLNVVLCAVDFSASSQRALDYAACVAAGAGARLLVAHVLEWSEEQDPIDSPQGRRFPTSEDDAVTRLNQLITEQVRTRCSPDLAVAYGDPADELLRLQQEHAAGMLVVGITRRNPIDLSMFGSTSRRIIRDGGCPVLTVGASDS